MKTLYITGAGVSKQSGIPTFRGNDGFWTVGSKNYTPQEMATRTMYKNHPGEFLLWYYERFAKYRNIKPNAVHFWLSDKMLVTQNIDGLDGKAGNLNYIPIHGRLDKVTLYHEQGDSVTVMDAPWDEVQKECPNEENKKKLKNVLLDVFRIPSKTELPEKMVSLKPFVLLFDEYYTDLYRFQEATSLMKKVDNIIFIGTSFSVNITNIALEHAFNYNIKVTIVDPLPKKINFSNVKYYKMSAEEFIRKK